MFRLGLILILIGAMMGDSECLLVPGAIVLTGCALVHFGLKREEARCEKR